MLARALYGVAVVLVAVMLLAIRSGTRGVAHYPVTLPGGIPAVVYEPGEPRGLHESPPTDERYPVVVLAHGFASNKSGMGVLARRLARSGYAVITFDFRGHGWNRTGFGYGWPLEALYDDLDQVVLYATTHPHLDPERLVLAGHSMGGAAIMGYAARSPGAAALVGISGASEADGPYPLPSTLLIWASGDPDPIRESLRGIGAKLAALERLVLERTYGEPERGTGVRISEVDGTDHVTILYSRVAAARIIYWLNAAVGYPRGTPRLPIGDARLLWAGLGLLSTVLLVFGAARGLAPAPIGEATQRSVHPGHSLLRLAGAHLATLVLFAGVDPLMGGGGLGWIPTLVGADLAGFFLLSGVFLGAFSLVRGETGFVWMPTGRELLAAAGLALLGYVLLVGVLSPFGDLRLPPHRIGWAAAAAALCLPFYLGTEWILRGDGRTRRWLSPAGKLLTLLFIAGGAVFELLPWFLLLALGAFVFLFVLFELVGARVARVNPGPWLPGLVQAAWTGWLIGCLFPVAG